jgi:energy-converting hydrogenase Eha subunit C
MYVSSIPDVIRGMLQVFHMDVVKVDRDVAYVASVLEACCKRLFEMFHLFQMYVASILYLDVAHISHICCKSMFKMFQLFHLMLQ